MTQNVVDFHSLQEQVDEVLPPAGTDSRTRAVIEKDSPSFGRFTELDGWSKILWKCLSYFDIQYEVKRHDHVLIDL